MLNEDLHWVSCPVTGWWFRYHKICHLQYKAFRRLIAYHRLVLFWNRRGIVIGETTHLILIEQANQIVNYLELLLGLTRRGLFNVAEVDF